MEITRGAFFIKYKGKGGINIKGLLKLLDLDDKEIYNLLDLADELKEKEKNSIEYKPLHNKTLGMIFEKSSTRTRVSFEVGMYQLGGHALFLNSNDLQIGRGESIKDTARVLSKYLDIIMIRTFRQSDVEELAKYATIPVINGLTDFSHPCQVLADLMTIREMKGKLKGLKLAYIGDSNNMANSLIVGGLKVGMDVSVAIPKEYPISDEILQFTSKYNNFSYLSNPNEAVKDADVIVTDVWTSMGNEKEREQREKIFKDTYQVNTELMKETKNDAIVLHCLPAHKGEEITEDVFENNANIIFEEAENRLHVQKAIMVKLMKGM